MLGRTRIHTRLKNPFGDGSQFVYALFENGEQGFAYDHNDFSTLFQDSAGTTPVTAAGQPVGLMLDKRLGLVRGAELVTNGDFSAGLNGWGAGAASTLGVLESGAVTIARSADSTTNTGLSSVPGTAQIGRWYEVRFDLLAGFGSLLLNDTLTIEASIGSKRYLIRNTRDRAFELRCFAESTATVDNISVRELPGNHRYTPAASPASRPILRQNATTGAYYLQYDGVDDFMMTNPVDFTSTDKASVFAGVRKLSDAGTAMLLELSSNFAVNAGAFGITAPVSAGPTYYAGASGAAGSYKFASVTGFAAPVSSVLSGFVSSSGATDSDRAQLRVNGTTPAQTYGGAWAAPTATMGNYSLYFGRRAGASLPFNGHEYSPVCVGRLTTAAETANIERMLARQVGVALV